MFEYYYSCVVDSHPKFYYQAWMLINSLIRKADVKASQIFVNHTNEVEKFFLDEVKKIGCKTVQIDRFGDGKYCNKIAQLDNRILNSSKCIFLLDTDMIVLDKINKTYIPDSICGKIVDLPNPEINILKDIFNRAGFKTYPNICAVDCEADETFHNNLNGGLYVIPGNLAKVLCEKWKKWALWLLKNM